MGPSWKLLSVYLLLLGGPIRWMCIVHGAGTSSFVEPLQASNQPGSFQPPRHNHHHHHEHPVHPLPLSSLSPPPYLEPWYYGDQGEPLSSSSNSDENNRNNNINYNNNNNNNFTLGGIMSEPAWAVGNESMEGNGTDIPEEESGGVSLPPLWRQIMWSILFAPMVVVACTGNVTVIWIVLKDKRMRTVTNYLLVNLSIADAMSSTINVIPNLFYMLTDHWPFGALYCKIMQFVSMLSICASVFSLMAIAMDRYMAIMNPLRPRMGKRLTLGIATGIWVGGTILSMPMLIFFQTYEFADGKIICYPEWPDGASTRSNQEFWYNIFFMIFTYFIPVAVMGFTYTRVGIELWGSKSIGECTQRQLDNIKSKRRVVKMMIVVVAIFAFCWLPYQMYFIWISMWPETTGYVFIRELYLGIYWLAMSNSMYNPIIYCWMNNRFRRGFQQVFRWCPFVHYHEVEGTTAYMMHTQRERETTRYSVTGSPELQLTRVSRNGSGSVHIHLHVLTNNDSGRSPSNRSMNTKSNSVGALGIPGGSHGQNHQSGGHHHHHHYNGNGSSKHQHQSSNSDFHRHHTQCHHLQRNFSNNNSNARGNTMV